MENAHWEHNLADNSYRFVLAANVVLTVQQVRDSLAAMQGINAPNPLYGVLVKAATDYMGRMGRTATEARARAEQQQAANEEMLRKAAESMYEDILRRHRSYFGFDFGAGPSFSAFHRAGGTRTAPPPRPDQPKHWKEVLGFNVNAHVAKHDAKAAYKRLAMALHQKHDGDQGAMHEELQALNVAKASMEKELGR